MTKTVMVLAPPARSQYIVDTRYSAAPFDVTALGEKLSILVNHAADDLQKCFIASKHGMAASQDIALHQALHIVFRQHFHDSAITRQILIPLHDRPLPATASSLEYLVKLVGISFVWAHETEVLIISVETKDLGQVSASPAHTARANSARDFGVFSELLDVWQYQRLINSCAATSMRRHTQALL